MMVVSSVAVVLLELEPRPPFDIPLPLLATAIQYIMDIWTCRQDGG